MTLEARNGDNLTVANVELDPSMVNQGTFVWLLVSSPNPAALSGVAADLIHDNANRVNIDQYQLDSSDYGADGGIAVADLGGSFMVESATLVR